MIIRSCLLASLMLTTIALATEADSGYRKDYAYALQSLDRNQPAAAVAALEEALAIQPEPRLAEDPGEPDYLPYLHLAIAYYQLGEMAAARKALETSGAKATVSKSYLGGKLWDRYALLIIAGGEDPIAEEGDYREFERQAYRLNDEDAEQIRNQVLQRCALSGSIQDNRLPWYFHYEFGTELMRAGDPQRALDALLLAANLREESRRNSRMYGMWFTDYLPYFRIAQAHSKLGNWRCAVDAMRLSARNREFSPVDPGYQEYSDLQQLILRQSEASDS